MSHTVRTIDYVLKKRAERNRVELVDVSHSGNYAKICVNRDALVFQLRPPRIVYDVELPGSVLSLGSATAIFEEVDLALARGAAALRGHVFRDLVTNDHHCPVDYIGEATDRDAVVERCERLAVELLSHVERIRK